MKRRIFAICCLLFAIFGAGAARAEFGIVDALNLAPFVPLVLGAFMDVAMAGYEFFVAGGRGEGGTGIIYILIAGWLAMYICLYLVKLYFPSTWLSFLGMKGDDAMLSGNIGIITGKNNIAEELIKPCIRAIIAMTILLQVRPQYVTGLIVDPFLRFGAIYTESISREIQKDNPMLGEVKYFPCPQDIIDRDYLSEDACNFLIRPVSEVTHANNIVIKHGLQFFTKGLIGLMVPIPRGGADFMNLITGMILVVTFVSSNFFMAFLIIQGIFNFGMALILYPFKVLTYVARNSPDWINPWPAFEGIIKSLKELVITMIACMFIMAVNIAAIKALFNWNGSIFTEYGEASGFGHHSLTWLSAILTFFLMNEIFKLAREKLNQYSGIENSLQKQVKADMNHTLGRLKGVWKAITK